MSVRFALGKNGIKENLDKRKFSPSEAKKYIYAFPILFLLFYIFYPYISFGLVLVIEVITAIIILKKDQGARPSFANLLARYSYSGITVFLTYVFPLVIITGGAIYAVKFQYGKSYLTGLITFINLGVVIFAQTVRIKIHKGLTASEYEEKLEIGSENGLISIVDSATGYKRGKELELPFNRDDGHTECPNCGKTVSALSHNCPFCNMAISRELVSCPECGRKNQRNMKFCLNCGNSLKKEPATGNEPGFCQNCDFDNDFGATYCLKCGEKLAGEKIPEKVQAVVNENEEEDIGFIELSEDNFSICPDCNSINEITNDFCFNCGEKLIDSKVNKALDADTETPKLKTKEPALLFDLFCPYCDAGNSNDSKFCFNCGKALKKSVRKADKRHQSRSVSPKTSLRAAISAAALFGQAKIKNKEASFKKKKEAYLKDKVAKAVNKKEIKAEAKVSKKLITEQEKLFESTSESGSSSLTGRKITQASFETPSLSKSPFSMETPDYQNPGYGKREKNSPSERPFEPGKEMAAPAMAGAPDLSSAPKYETMPMDSGLVGPNKGEGDKTTSPSFEKLYAASGKPEIEKDVFEKRNEKVCKKCVHYDYNELVCKIGKKPVYNTYCYSAKKR